MSDSLSVATIEAIIAGERGEDGKIELKWEFPPTLKSTKDNIAKDVAAFANSEIGGHIIFGICDKTNDKGTRDYMTYPYHQGNITATTSAIRDRVKPQPNMGFYHSDPIPGAQSTRFIVLHVRGQSQNIHLSKGIAYIRYGEESIPMPPERMKTFFENLISNSKRREVEEAENRYSILFEDMLMYIAYCELSNKNRDLDNLLDDMEIYDKETRIILRKRLTNSNILRTSIQDFEFVSESLRDWYAGKYLATHEFQMNRLLYDEHWEETLVNLACILDDNSTVEYIISSFLESGKYIPGLRCFIKRRTDTGGALKSRIMNIVGKNIKYEYTTYPFRDFFKRLLRDMAPDIRLEAIRFLPSNDDELLDELLWMVKPSSEDIDVVRREAIIRLGEVTGTDNVLLSERIVGIFVDGLNPENPNFESRADNRIEILRQLESLDSDQARTICQKIINENSEEDCVIEVAGEILDKLKSVRS